MKNPAKAIFVIYLLASLIPNRILTISSVADFKNKIPALKPQISPKELGKHSPNDWGVIPHNSTGGYVWYWTKDIVIEDTSHANRTVWLATKAYHEDIIDRTKLDGFINTLKHQIWAPDKGPFYFNNFIDGTDKGAFGMGPGEIGNIWFGWHRLAAYDDSLKDLFISIAYDLTNDGPNIPKGAQNKAMESAPLCLFAWAARLLSPNSQLQRFP